MLDTKHDEEFIMLKKEALEESKAELYFNKWMSLQPSDLVNIFYVCVEDSNTKIVETQRAITYKLSRTAFDNMMTAYSQLTTDEKQRSTLTFYMGVDPNYSAGGIQVGTPAFALFAKLVTPANSTPFANAVEMDWQEQTGIPIDNTTYYGPPNAKGRQKIYNYNHPSGSFHPQGGNASPISPKTASLFVYEWSRVTDARLPDLFSALVIDKVSRVRSYFFSYQDLDLVLAEWDGGKSGLDLFIHLAVIRPLFRTPFNFHLVMETRVDDSGSSGGGEAAPDSNGGFYEYSYPCPPFCG
ncbi:MAG: hypothetical protein AAF990_27215 [Bacteroidota bacterium]